MSENSQALSSLSLETSFHFRLLADGESAAFRAQQIAAHSRTYLGGHRNFFLKTGKQAEADRIMSECVAIETAARTMTGAVSESSKIDNSLSRLSNAVLSKFNENPMASVSIVIEKARCAIGADVTSERVHSVYKEMIDAAIQLLHVVEKALPENCRYRTNARRLISELETPSPKA